MTTSSDSSERRSDAAWRSPLAWTVLLPRWSSDSPPTWSRRTGRFARWSANPWCSCTRDRRRWRSIPFHPGVPAVSPDLLDFRLVLNRGAVFGIGQGRRVAFVVFTTVAIVVALAASRMDPATRVPRTRRRAHPRRWPRQPLRPPRVRRPGLPAHVPRRDLPLGFSWPRGDTEVFPWVFNVADVELLVGMCLLLIHVHLVDRRAKRDEVASSTPTNEGSAARGLQEAEEQLVRHRVGQVVGVERSVETERTHREPADRAQCPPVPRTPRAPARLRT